MELNDVSDASFGERFRGFYNDHKSATLPFDQNAFDAANQLAKEEMLDEIHVMLRSICIHLKLVEPKQWTRD